MNELARSSVIGRRIVDVIVARPDKPVSMSDQSFSAGYVRLDSGIVIDLCGKPPLHAVSEDVVRIIARDRAYEKEFTPALGKTIADVLFDDLVIYLVTDAKSVISMVPALFWVRPCIESDCESLTDCRPIW